MHSSKIYKSNIYELFQGIGAGEHRSIIRFYEEHLKELKDLDDAELFEFNITYAQALFEVGSYNHFLDGIDGLIEEVMEKNVQLYHGQDLFFDLLTKKASAHHELYAFETSAKISKQLIRIKPNDPVGAMLHEKNLLSQKPNYVKSFRAVSIFLFLFSALFCAAEVLLIRPFFDYLYDTTLVIRNTIFIAGIVSLIGAELFHFLNVKGSVARLVYKAKKEKSF